MAQQSDTVVEHLVPFRSSGGVIQFEVPLYTVVIGAGWVPGTGLVVWTEENQAQERVTALTLEIVATGHPLSDLPADTIRAHIATIVVEGLGARHVYENKSLFTNPLRRASKRSPTLRPAPPPTPSPVDPTGYGRPTRERRSVYYGPPPPMPPSRALFQLPVDD